jgi:PAS domain S-box-containing protein
VAQRKVDRRSGRPGEGGVGRKDLAIINAISEQINSRKSLSALLPLIAKQMVKTTGVEHSTITLLDPSRAFYAVKVEYPQLIGNLKDSRLQVGGRPLQERMLRDKKPIVVPDLANHALAKESPEVAAIGTQIGIKSMLIVPMVSRGDVLGTISVDALKRRKRFNQKEIELYKTIANQAAIAIRNAYQFDQAKHQIRALKILNSIVPFLNCFNDHDVYERACQGVKRIFRCERSEIWILKPAGADTVLRAEVSSTGDPCEVELPATHPDPQLSPLLRSLHGGSLITKDACQDYRPAEGRNRRIQPRAMVVAPIKIGDQNVGVISAADCRAGWFRDRDRLLLETLALSAGTALQRIMSLDTLEMISERLIRADRLGSVLRAIVESAKMLTFAESGVIFLFDERATKITDPFEASGDIKHPVPRLNDENGITRAVIRHRRIIVIDDIKEDTRVNPKLVVAGYRSMIAVPLLVNDRILGVLYLNDRGPHRFSENDKSLLTTLANHASAAVEKTQVTERYSSLVKNLPFGLFCKDTNLKFKFVNPAFLRQLKLTEDTKVVDKRNSDFLPPEIAAQFERDDHEVLSTGKPLEKIYDLPEYGTLKVYKSPVLDGTGKVREIQGILWDLSDEIRLLERAQAAVLAPLNVGVIVSKQGHIVSANPHMRELLGGVDENALTGHSIEDIVSPKDRRAFLKRVKRADDVKESRPFETRLQFEGAKGKPMKVTVGIYPVAGTGELEMVFSTSRM